MLLLVLTRFQKFAPIDVTNSPSYKWVVPFSPFALDSISLGMHSTPIFCAFLVTAVAFCSVSGRVLQRRQTFNYPEELREHAQRFQPWTRMLHGMVNRYAPEEWPAWFSRSMMVWDVQPRPRYGPYHPNDSRYVRYKISQIKEAAPTTLNKEAPGKNLQKSKAA